MAGTDDLDNKIAEAVKKVGRLTVDWKTEKNQGTKEILKDRLVVAKKQLDLLRNQKKSAPAKRLVTKPLGLGPSGPNIILPVPKQLPGFGPGGPSKLLTPPTTVPEREPIRGVSSRIGRNRSKSLGLTNEELEEYGLTKENFEKSIDLNDVPLRIGSRTIEEVEDLAPLPAPEAKPPVVGPKRTWRQYLGEKFTRKKPKPEPEYIKTVFNFKNVAPPTVTKYNVNLRGKIATASSAKPNKGTNVTQKSGPISRMKGWFTRKNTTKSPVSVPVLKPVPASRNKTARTRRNSPDKNGKNGKTQKLRQHIYRVLAAYAHLKAETDTLEQLVGTIDKRSSNGASTASDPKSAKNGKSNTTAASNPK